MALRLHNHVLRGEIRNSTQNSVYGYFVVAQEAANTRDAREHGCEIIHFSLTGNLKGELAGRSFRFDSCHEECGGYFQQFPSQRLDDHFRWRQVGSMGDGEIRMIREVPHGVTIEEIASGTVRVPLEPTALCLYFEWYGQNGRIVLEIVRPTIQFLEEPSRHLDVIQSGCSHSASRQADTSQSLSGPPGGKTHQKNSILASPSAPEHSARCFGLDDNAPLFDQEIDEFRLNDDDYSEMTIEEDELWEFDFASDNLPSISQPTLTSIVQTPPIRELNVDQLTDEEAWEALGSILSQLALNGIALDMCPHCSPQRAINLLISKLLPETVAPPLLNDPGLILHLSTWDHCRICEAEFQP
ncbi:MAG: hypothetical protein JNL58_15850 [Planctomyces sp.]|nr:hypothetical protein [Planctomyces sp.]